MSQLILTVVADASFSGGNAPSLQVLIGGTPVSAQSISAGSNTYTFLIEYTGTYPSSLALRFDPASGDPGDTINISQAYIGGHDIYSDLTSTLLTQSASGSYNTLANSYVFGRDEPGPGDFGPPTHSGSGNVTGSGNADIIKADLGNKRVRGLDGNDFIFGSSGNDTIYGEVGHDMMLGQDGNDLLLAGDGDDLVYGGTGDDTLLGEDGNDIINGGTGNDTIYGDAGTDILYGEDGNDVLSGGIGNDYLFGDAGNDTLAGGGGDDVLLGGDNDDLLSGAAGNDEMYGEDGDDLLSGGAGNDLMFGGAGEDELNGGAGNDQMDGGTGNDIMNGGAGDDTIDGDAGDDTIIGGTGADLIDGGDGNDIIHGNGLNELQIANILSANPSVVYSKETGSFYQYVNSAVDYAAAQTAAAAATLSGVAGHLVTITSATENNYISNLIGGTTWSSGQDVLEDGTWQWTAGPESGLQFSDINGNAVNNMYESWDGGQPQINTEFNTILNTNTLWHDWADSSSHRYVIEWEVGQFSDDDAADDLSGGAGNDWIYGYGGDDTLNGDAGDDFLFGGDGDDTMDGGVDDDILVGGLGSDTIFGGTGNDILYAAIVGTVGAQTVVSAGPAIVNILTANFSSDTDGFTYADGVFGSSGSSNSYASGTRITSDGDQTSSGALQVSLGGINNNTISTMSGAYQQTFNLTDAMSNITLDFSYRVIDPSWDGDAFDSGEDTELYVDIDGTTYSNDANPYFFQITGPAAGASYDSGWQTISLNIGSLSAGNHTISLGGLLTGKSWNSEEMEIRFDDLVMQGEIASVVTLVDENFDTDTGVFSYSDGGFGGSDGGGVTVSGSRDTGDGATANGSLEVDIQRTGTYNNASGNWSTTLNPGEDLSNVQITFSYRHWHASQNDNNEDSWVYLEFDGTIYDASGGNSHISEALGSGGTTDTGWVTVTVDLPDMVAGNSYDLSLGIYHDGANASNEDAYVRFDDITVTGLGAGGGGGGSGNDATSSGNDSTESNYLDGGDGNDILYGSAGADTLYGGAGSDTLYSDSAQTYTVADALAEIAGLEYNEDTNSFYLYVSGAVTAPTAFTNAAAQSLNGIAGHIVHITSATENAYIDSLTGTATVWLGAQDTAVEGEWLWIGGPNDGELFWLGDETGSSQNGYYENFNGGEPNDWTGGEDYLEMQNGGGWNDNGGPQQPGLTRGYVIEWEASEVFSYGATILNGGSGADDLYGSAGADLFVFDSNSGDAFTNPDTVHNFDRFDGDALDISDILDGLGVTSANLSDYVDISEGNGLRIDTSGSGNFTGNEIATFSGETAVTDEATMLANGNLIIY